MDDKIIEEAISWHAAQLRDDCDWKGFTTWLGADPQHRAAFDDVALLDEKLGRQRELLAQILPPEPVATVVEPNRRPRSWAGFGFGAAAVVAAAIAVPMILPGGEQSAYETTPRQTRTIALADGSQVALASSSRLIVDKSNPNEISLDGAAWFSVRHNPLRSLVIHAGDYRITDIGTRFEIATSDQTLKVAVAEGTVSVVSGGLTHAVTVRQGQRLMVSRDIALAELGTINSEDVASWRSGRLVYQDVPLSLVAADITRYAGKSVVADPAVARQRFSGVLSVGNGKELVDNLAQIMGLSVRSEGDGVRLLARTAS